MVARVSRWTSRAMMDPLTSSVWIFGTSPRTGNGGMFPGARRISKRLARKSSRRASKKACRE